MIRTESLVKGAHLKKNPSKKTNKQTKNLQNKTKRLRRFSYRMRLNIWISRWWHFWSKLLFCFIEHEHLLSSWCTKYLCAHSVVHGKIIWPGTCCLANTYLYKIEHFATLLILRKFSEKTRKIFLKFLFKVMWNFLYEKNVL